MLQRWWWRRPIRCGSPEATLSGKGGSAVSVLDAFHPAVAAWFRRSFDAPTPAQEEAWPAIRAAKHVLIAAPTGSGKTFAAFLTAIDELVRSGLKSTLPDAVQLVDVSP